MRSLLFGSAFEIPTDDPLADDYRVRVYHADGRAFVGHDSWEMAHACDEACAARVVSEADGDWQACEGSETAPDAYVSLAEELRTDGTGTGNYPTIDVGGFDPGDDPYVVCDACGAELHRDDEAYEAMYGARIDA